MNSEIFEKILKSINKRIGLHSKCVVFNNKDFIPLEVSRERFCEIGDTAFKGKVAFLDGGNAEIVRASSFSVNFVRVYYAIYEHARKVLSKRYEFFVLISAVKTDGKLEYLSETFPVNYEFENLRFSLNDETLSSANSNVDISSVSCLIRRLAEIKVATDITETLNSDDVVVLDGTLEANATFEKDYMSRLISSASNRSITISALAKSSDLLTDSGDSAQVFLSSLAPFNTWYYPITTTALFDTYFVKLHESSKHVFRFDINKKSQLQGLLAYLKSTAKDPVFIGYPYPLIHVDRIARVSNLERDALNIQFIAKLGKDHKRLQSYLNTCNAHSILDSIG